MVPCVFSSETEEVLCVSRWRRRWEDVIGEGSRPDLSLTVLMSSAVDLPLSLS